MKPGRPPRIRAASALVVLVCCISVVTVGPALSSAASPPGAHGARSFRLRPLIRPGRGVSSSVLRDTRSRSRLHIAIYLRIQPNPVALQQPLMVTLHGVLPRQRVTFTVLRRAPGALGRLLGRYRAEGGGVVRFRPRPFSRFEDVGRWVVMASFNLEGNIHVLRATLTVAGLLLWPHSARAQRGKPYPFRLYTHCGVNFSVDFDHAFWDLTDPRWTDQPSGLGPNKRLGNPFQSGTMTLVDARHARFDFVPITPGSATAAAPASIHFTRHVGPKIVPGFCS